ncbi:hypothetical protein A2U01_0106460, partial [Trifolium medium]|nr:hypothetical protein [Trifolium medium]
MPSFTLLGVTSHTKLRSRNSSIKSNSFIISDDMCKDFLLNASATTLAFPG